MGLSSGTKVMLMGGDASGMASSGLFGRGQIIESQQTAQADCDWAMSGLLVGKVERGLCR